MTEEKKEEAKKELEELEEAGKEMQEAFEMIKKLGGFSICGTCILCQDGGIKRT